MASAASVEAGDRRLISALRQVFELAGYNEQALFDTVGDVRLWRLSRQGSAHLRHLTRRGRPLDTLIRLFLLGLPEDLDIARQALAPLALEEWQRAGMIRIENSRVRGAVRMLAFRDLLLACEDNRGNGAAPRSDLVMGFTSSTALLGYVTVPIAARATLDLGTGNGIQALMAADHSERVWATDYNARALEFARFNAILNRREDRIEFLQGDRFEPVRGRKFDLIVCNPPYAISPSNRYAYRDGGMANDEFARSVIREATAALNEGGFCQIICEWVQLAGQPWQERLAAWVDGLQCNAWILCTNTQEPGEYADAWIGATEHLSPGESDRLYLEWLDYYRQQRIESISTGMIALCKASGRRNWVRMEDARVLADMPFGEDVLRGFAASDFLAGLEDEEALLAIRLRISDQVRLDHFCGWQDSEWRIRSARIRLAGAMPYESNIDQRFAAMLAMCNGERTVGQVLEQTAVAHNTSVSAIAPNCLSLIRQLIERGFLVPVR